MKHHYNLVDQERTRPHRHLPTCSCGWLGVPRDTKDGAAQEWRTDHLRREQTAARRARRRRAPRPRALTPVDELPELLRPPPPAAPELRRPPVGIGS